MNEFERQSLRLHGWQIFVSAVVPVISVVGAALVAVWTISGDLRLQAQARADQAQAQRAQVIAESGEVVCSFGPIFTADLGLPGGDEFGALDDVDELAEFCEQPPIPSVQQELVQQLVEHPDQREEILAMWRAVYEVEGWIDDIEAVIEN